MKVLIEFGVEELPAWPFLKELDNILPKWQKALNERGLSGEFSLEYTPRRIVLAGELPQSADDKIIEHIGAPKALAIDKDGAWSKAALAFAQKCGLESAQLSFKNIKGKEVLYHKSTQKGLSTKELLGEIMSEFIASLNFGRAMRWGSGSSEFIRPLRSLFCLVDDELLPCEIFGVKAAKSTFVHRDFSYDLQGFNTSKEYYSLLAKNGVILSANERKERIIEGIKELEKTSGLKVELDSELLREVVAITEYPTPLLGSFDESFLEVPAEVIITSMKENQRYFAVRKASGELANAFVVVCNSTSDDGALIVAGNERVLRARLSDAQFFWHSDLKAPFNAAKLKNITFLAGLGTMADKSARECEIASILGGIYASELAKECGDNFKDELKSAAMLAKADLSTAMVYEFTDLQGIMGGYYAKASGQSERVCAAIRQQYLPNSEDSELPSSLFSSIIALASKLDSLMGLFSIGKIPSGTKDPYALRRASLGVLKIVLNLGINFELEAVLNAIKAEYKDFDISTLRDFILERLYALKDVNASIIKAALSSGNCEIKSLNATIDALDELSKASDFESNFDTFKRLANILKGEQISANVDESLLSEPCEKALFSAFKALKLDKSDVGAYFKELFSLKASIDDFFENVMINDENEKVRTNRKALISAIYGAFLALADIKEISVS